MDIIERYLANVRVLLPKSQRDDIIAELRDALIVCREEESAELGRPLTPEEEERLLREFGHPISVAGRYRSSPQYLIGPDLYAVYVFVLKLVLLILAAAAVIVGVVTLVASGGAAGTAIARGIAVVWNGAFAAVGVVTVIFAILQRSSLQLPLFWRARDLPVIKGQGKARRASWVEHVAGIVANTIFILWWIRVIQVPADLPLQNGQGLHLALAPVWSSLYWPVLIVAFGGIAVHVLRLTQAGRGRLGHALDLALQLGIIAIALVALNANRWVVVSGLSVPAHVIAEVDRGVNVALLVSLIVLACMGVARGGYDLWRLSRGDETAALAG